eukprot:scaffold1410_cov76-Skeletonema_dohrnii-CCMP3373.AAC.3
MWNDRKQSPSNTQDVPKPTARPKILPEVLPQGARGRGSGRPEWVFQDKNIGGTGVSRAQEDGLRWG